MSSSEKVTVAKATERAIIFKIDEPDLLAQQTSASMSSTSPNLRLWPLAQVILKDDRLQSITPGKVTLAKDPKSAGYHLAIFHTDGSPVDYSKLQDKTIANLIRLINASIASPEAKAKYGVQEKELAKTSPTSPSQRPIAPAKTEGGTVTVKGEKLNPVEIRFTSNVPILEKLYSQQFGVKETERLALCPFAQNIIDTDGVRIGSVKLEKPQNGTGSIITIRSLAHSFTDEQVELLTERIKILLHPMNRAAAPINEDALLARLSQDEFVPNPSIPYEVVFASNFNKNTIPGVRGHGGNIEVRKFHDQGPNKPLSVELVAHGSCMGCGSAGTITLNQLHRLQASIFKQLATEVQGRTFGDIFVYQDSEPDTLAYIVKADGVYQPDGKTKATTSPAAALMTQRNG